MRAISLWQPWASLIAFGAKRFETRSWRAHQSVIGRMVAIHAAARKDVDSLGLCLREPFRSALVAGGIEKIGELPFGAIVCVARIVAVHPTAEIAGSLAPGERAFGDYAPGRFAWELADVVPFEEPIAFRGAQGFFPVPDHVLRLGRPLAGSLAYGTD